MTEYRLPLTLVLLGVLILSAQLTAAKDQGVVELWPGQYVTSTLPAELPDEIAQVIHVPGDYPTIGQALAVAQAGDTVQVAAGTYQEGTLGMADGVSLIGAGWENTIIDGGGDDVVIYPAPDSLIEGFTIQGSGPDYFDTALWVDEGTVVIRQNRITGNSTGLWAWCSDPTACHISVIFEQNLVDGNSSSGINSNEHPIIEVRNNTVVDNGSDGLVLNNPSSLAENNIIVGHSSGLVDHLGATVRYNDVWGNGQDYSSGDPGEGGLAMDPMFRDMDGGDYRLHAGSPAVSHGTPDGTDMGALPFAPVGSPLTEVSVSQTGDFEWTVFWDGNGAAGYNVYIGTQSALYTYRFDAGTSTTYLLSGLPGDLTYYVAVSGYDNVGDESDVSSEVSFYVPPAPDGIYQEDSLVVALTGDWVYLTNDQASSGGYAVSDTPGDTVQFTFSGDSIVLSRTLDIDGGQAEVSIDGQSLGTLEFYFVEQRWQVPAIFDHLGSGSHTLTLQVSNGANPDSTGHKVYIDAFAVPSPYTPTVAQQQALERVNWYRQVAGIPLVKAPSALNMAAQAHAEYDVINGKTDGHQEISDKPGFVGQWPSERAAYFGYSGGVGEDMHGLGEPLAAIDDFMATVYHRNLIMGYGFTDMGYGIAVDDSYRSDVLDMSSRNFSGPAPTTRLLFTYPASSQINVPHLWGGGESPDPLPDLPRPVGYPVSLYIAQPAGLNVQLNPSERFPWLAPKVAHSTEWEVTTAELRDPNEQLVPTYLLDQATDPNNFLGPDNVFLIAHEPLAFSTTYTAHIAGTDSQGVAFEHTWSFTTEIATTISNIRVEPSACGANFNWNTAGDATTSIEYGPTKDYGWQLPGESNPTSFHSVVLSDLTPNTTYHYRIVSQDTQGNSHTTEDQTFATRSPQVYSVPEAYSTIQDALHSAASCDIVQVAAGIYQEGTLGMADGVSLIGAGWENTIIDGGGDDVVIYPAPDSLIEGFTIQGSGPDYFDTALWVDEGTVVIRQNRITGNSTGLWAWCSEPAACHISVIFEQNLVDGNSSSGINSNEYPILEIRNNTVVDNGSNGIILNNASSLAENNIIVQNSNVGLTGNNNPTVRYNDVWANGQDYVGVSPGIGAISDDPMFVDDETGDYHLTFCSPAIDAGNPTSDYSNEPKPNGSRINMGAYGNTSEASSYDCPTLTLTPTATPTGTPTLTPAGMPTSTPTRTGTPESNSSWGLYLPLVTR